MFICFKAKYKPLMTVEQVMKFKNSNKVFQNWTLFYPYSNRKAVERYKSV